MIDLNFYAKVFEGKRFGFSFKMSSNQGHRRHKVTIIFNLKVLFINKFWFVSVHEHAYQITFRSNQQA